ncbi:MAG TPA: helix-hairpin-helix domain-containing protein [Bacilli bacterium]
MYSSFSPIKKIVIMSTLLLLLGLIVVLYLSIKAEGSQIGQWVDVSKQMEKAINQVSVTNLPKEQQVASTGKKPQSTPVKETQIASTADTLSASPAPMQQQPTVTPVLAEVSTEAAGLININIATVAELDELPGIGPSKAKAIVDHRLKIGGFTSLEQLMDVKGIGSVIFAKVRGEIKL